VKNLFIQLKERVEKLIPMRLGSFLLFLFIIYLLIIVGKTIWTNYKSNKSIVNEQAQIQKMQDELIMMQYQINYLQTYSFKEKEAREKLGYKAPGENVLSMPIDKEEDKETDSSLTEAEIRVPNYKLWYKYFMGN
jgi:cell division protein FtsB